MPSPRGPPLPALLLLLRGRKVTKVTGVTGDPPPPPVTTSVTFGVLVVGSRGTLGLSLGVVHTFTLKNNASHACNCV